MKKILSIIISLLFLITIPSVMGVNPASEDIDHCLDIGRVLVFGLLFNPPKSEPPTYFAIWLYYPTEEGMKLIILDWVTLDFSPYLGRMHTLEMRLFIFVFGFIEDGLEIR